MDKPVEGESKPEANDVANEEAAQNQADEPEKPAEDASVEKSPEAD
jgi:hypothetical protein